MTPSTTGSVEVTTSTAGADPDPDGYTLTLDGADRGPLEVSASVTLTGLTPGSHVVGLSGIAANCQVNEDNPRAVTIAAGASTAVGFSVTCAAPPPEAGTLRITTVTTGLDHDPDGYTFAVDGGSSQPIGVNAVASLASVAVGGHNVQLSGVASNCVVEGTNPRAVTVSSGTTTELGFAVSCTAVTAGTPSASASAVAAAPLTVTIGTETSTITVTVRDGNNNLLVGVPVTLSSTGTGNAISPASAASGANGQATFTFGSTVAETKTITAMAGGVEITQKATVTVRNRLELVSARDHIPGSFVAHRVVYADRDRIYLGSSQGSLFVLARDRASNFPVVQTIDLGVPVTGVRGDDDRLYVTSGDGLLRIFAKASSLGLVKTLALSTFGLGTVELFEGKIYVTLGQAELAVDRDRLYLSQSNEGEVALEVDKATLQTTRTYGNTFIANKTVVYDRLTGAQVATIPNPADLFGVISLPRLYADGQSLMQTIAGCCGTGITIVKAPGFTESEFIGAPNTNAVAAAGNGLLGGSEAGRVDYFEQNQLVQQLGLRLLTGHTGSEDIEIRSLWADGVDDLVFAGSSWGNDASRSLSLPAFFVLSLR